MSQIRWSHVIAAPLVVAVAGPAYATDYLTVAQAQRVLFPSAQGFQPQPVTLDKGQLDRIRKIAGVPQRTAQPKIWRAMGADGFQGWMFVDEVIGKHEFITYAAAISPDGHVLGIEIMSYRETKGDQVRNERWRSLFKGKTLADPFRLGKDVPNISGATLSCRNITDGVKRLLAIRAVALTPGG